LTCPCLGAILNRASAQGFQPGLHQLSFLTKESRFQRIITNLLESTPPVLYQRGLGEDRASGSAIGIALSSHFQYGQPDAFHSGRFRSTTSTNGPRTHGRSRSMTSTNGPQPHGTISARLRPNRPASESYHISTNREDSTYGDTSTIPTINSTNTPSTTHTRASQLKIDKNPLSLLLKRMHFKRRERALGTSAIGRATAVKEALDQTVARNRFEQNRSPKISSSKPKGRVLSSQMTEQHNK
jgi:hypothetical protein